MLCSSWRRRFLRVSEDGGGGAAVEVLLLDFVAAAAALPVELPEDFLLSTRFCNGVKIKVNWRQQNNFLTLPELITTILHKG